jgi:Zn-dependent peptidase ImmA (M78 family)/transcriptional regulator with XRE-family HTH domain
MSGTTSLSGAQEARLAAALSQEELGHRIGLDRTMVAKIETGARRIDAVELTRLASALSLPLDHFLYSRPAVVSRRAELLEEEATEAGRESYLLEASLLAWLRDVRQMIDLDVLTVAVPLKYGSTVDSETTARQAACWLRQNLNLGSGPIPSLMSVCERAGVLPVVADLPGDGASLIDGDVAVAVISRTGDPGRRRATAAHELGHVILGDEYSTDLGVSTSRRDREAVIHAFAAEFLLPVEAFDARSATFARNTLVRVAATYRTSWSLAVRQAGRAGLLDSASVTRWLPTTPTKAELSEAVGWTPQPDLDSVRVPPSFAQAVIDAYRRNLIAPARAVELLRGQIAEEDLPRTSEDDVLP